MLMSVIVRSFMPGERLNLGPLDRRSISWVLRLRVRSVTRLALFVVSLAEGLVLLVTRDAILRHSKAITCWSL